MNVELTGANNTSLPEQLQAQKYEAVIDHAPNSAVGLYHDVAEAYFNSQVFNVESQAHVGQLVSRLRANDQTERVIEPAFTIAIPIAYNESPAKIRHTIHKISTVHGIEHAEVVLFGNAPAEHKDSLASFNELASELQSNSGFALRYVTQDYPSLRILEVRRDYMDMIALEGKDRSYRFDHPVLWLDADVNDIAKNYAESIIPKIRVNDSTDTPWYPSVETDVRYSFSEDGARDDAVKFAVLKELIVRAALRSNLEAAAQLYPEESGLAIALGVHALQTENFAPWIDFDEAPCMLAHIESSTPLLEQALRKMAPHKSLRAPEGLLHSHDKPAPELMDVAIFVPETHVTVSGRRNVATARALLQRYQRAAQGTLASIMQIRAGEEAYYRKTGPPAFRRDAGGYSAISDFAHDRCADNATTEAVRLSRGAGYFALSHWLRGAEDLFDTPDAYRAVVTPLLARYDVEFKSTSIGNR